MARIESEIVIRAPLAEVFRLVGDGENAPRWSVSVSAAHHTTPPPIQVGSRLTVTAHAGARTYQWTQEVTRWDPPTAFEDTMVPGPGPFRRFKDWALLTPLPEGVRFQFGLDYALRGGPFGWLIDRLVVAPRVRKDMARSLERVRGILEGPSAPMGASR